MGLAYNIYLNAKRIYGCKNCKTHLADHDEIISRVSTIPTHFFSTLPTFTYLPSPRISAANTAKPTSSTPS